jgi:hypothetical protein
VIAVMPQMRLLVAVEPVDFRNGIDGLVAVCRQRLSADPMSGAVFIFGSRNRKSIKILVYDGAGVPPVPEAAFVGAFPLVAQRGPRSQSAFGSPPVAVALVER